MNMIPRVKRFIVRVVAATILIVASSSSANAQTHVWSQRFGEANEQLATSVATDASGNVIVTGYFSGTVDFGGGPLTSAGSRDIYVAKFNSAGVHQWSKRFGDANDQFAHSVATDASGNVITTGAFFGTVNFGGGPLTSAGSVDIYVAKFNAAGVHQWSKRFGNLNAQYEKSVATDASGNVIVTGYYGGGVDFGGGPLTGEGSIFLVKFNAAGVHQWSQLFEGYGGEGRQYGYSVATDTNENVIITGAFFGTVDFGGGPLTGESGASIFVAKFDAAGVHQWSQRFGDGNPLKVSESVATDASGNVFVTGDFDGTANFGGGDLISAGGSDIFLVKFDAAGVHQWSKRFGNLNAQHGNSVAIDASGNVFVTGYFDGTANFGGGNLISAGSSDIFVAKYNSAGVHQWSQRFGDANDQLGNSVATEGSGNAIVAGYFRGTVDFGSGPFTSMGGLDIFVAKFREIVTTATAPTLGTVLGQNHPNPFNPSTTITYTLSSRASIAINIYDATGVLIATLAQGLRDAGTYSTEWDGRDSVGRAVASGVYLYRLDGVKDRSTKKMTLLK